ncbi:MAG TPA: hypothetical protein VFK42_03885 [Acidimicrobiales bacterium]|nr:hypothetical protein [Acidimicrobiales bacterium]
MKKLLAAGAMGLLLAGGSLTGALAAPGPNGHNNHGLCTAYFNGSDTGRAHKHQAGPFQALQQAADDGDSNTSPEQDVWNWCNDATNNPKGIGGNPTPPQ